MLSASSGGQHGMMIEVASAAICFSVEFGLAMLMVLSFGRGELNDLL